MNLKQRLLLLAKSSVVMALIMGALTLVAFTGKEMIHSSQSQKVELSTKTNQVDAPVLSQKQLEKVSKKIDKIEKFAETQGGKSQWVALILCWLLGTLGIHRFYLGYTWQGIVQLLTAGACGIWTLIDLIRIFMGTLKPAGGSYDTTI